MQEYSFLIYLFIIFIILFLIYHQVNENFAGGAVDKDKFNPTGSCINDCVYAHNDMNLPWLDYMNNGIDHVEYQEPVDNSVPLSNGKYPPEVPWKRFTRSKWVEHCSKIDHTPSNLIKSHYDAYLNPDTKFATLRYVFRNGVVVQPTPLFYRLESDWFKNSGTCAIQN